MNQPLPRCPVCGGALFPDPQAPGWVSCVLCGRELQAGPDLVIPDEPIDSLSRMLRADALLCRQEREAS